MPGVLLPWVWEDIILSHLYFPAKFVLWPLANQLFFPWAELSCRWFISRDHLPDRWRMFYHHSQHFCQFHEEKQDCPFKLHLSIMCQDWGFQRDAPPYHSSLEGDLLQPPPPYEKQFPLKLGNDNPKSLVISQFLCYCMHTTLEAFAK